MTGNTLYMRSLERLITYRSAVDKSMIDYVLVKAKDRRYLKNVNEERGRRSLCQGWKTWLLKDVEIITV